MAQRLRAYIMFQEDPSSMFSTHTGQFTKKEGKLWVLFLGSMNTVPTHVQTYASHTHIKKRNLKTRLIKP